MNGEIIYVVILVVGAIIGFLGYKAKISKILRLISQLLDELSDDAEVIAQYLENPTDENANKVLEELKDDLPILAKLIELIKR